ncbi:hypothetical protein [Blastomonas fulva]|jgi:hypothetical protein|uniref:hypothetical protein n=1 Tax=Blastomonas fulva TaxID=1550728 RepID=UPI003D2E7775
MARGGYVRTEIAVNQLFMVVGERNKAKQFLVDALISGAMSAKGRRIREWRRDPTPKGSLRDLTADDPSLEAILDEIGDIPTNYWADLSEKNGRKFDWKDGQFWGGHVDHHGYQDVVFREKDINALLVLHKESARAAPHPKERLRNSTWDDWVAAVAIVASEQKIVGGMKQDDLFGLVNAKLQEWGLEEKEISTVSPAASAILRRFRENPPVKPMA